jgi:hypothetical protein
MFSGRLRGVNRPSMKERKKSKSKESLVERRKRKRFKIKEGVFAILNGTSAQLGEITDASGSGLAFKYQGEEKLWKQSSELEILALNDNYKIKRLPIRGVWDSKTANEMRKRGVQFGKLTYKQRSQIKFFMQNYSL